MTNNFNSFTEIQDIMRATTDSKQTLMNKTAVNITAAMLKEKW